GAGRPRGPAAATAPDHAAPALPDGAGLVLVVNAAAQSVQGELDELQSTVRERLPRAEVVLCKHPDDLPSALEQAAKRARVLGVAGGDGTVSAAAGVALAHELPLVVAPVGHLNHFAGGHGVRDGRTARDAGGG